MAAAPSRPIRHSSFVIRHLLGRSYRLALASDFDEAAGELRLTLTCSRCRQCEVLKVR